MRSNELQKGNTAVRDAKLTLCFLKQLCMYLDCSCGSAFPPVDMHILNSYTEGVYRVSDSSMKFTLKK